MQHSRRNIHTSIVFCDLRGILVIYRRCNQRNMTVSATQSSALRQIVYGRVREVEVNEKHKMGLPNKLGEIYRGGRQCVSRVQFIIVITGGAHSSSLEGVPGLNNEWKRHMVQTHVGEFSLTPSLQPYKLHGECARNSEFHLALPLVRNPRGHSRTTIAYLPSPILFLHDYVLLQSFFEIGVSHSGLKFNCSWNLTEYSPEVQSLRYFFTRNHTIISVRSDFLAFSSSK